MSCGGHDRQSMYIGVTLNNLRIHVHQDYPEAAHAAGLAPRDMVRKLSTALPGRAMDGKSRLILSLVMRGGSSFIEMVFKALPILSARSAKEHIVGIQRFGP